MTVYLLLSQSDQFMSPTKSYDDTGNISQTPPANSYERAVTAPSVIVERAEHDRRWDVIERILKMLMGLEGHM